MHKKVEFHSFFKFSFHRSIWILSWTLSHTDHSSH